VGDHLKSADRELEVEVQIITTTGDRVLDTSLPVLGAQAKGLFTKEIEEALFDRRVDIAVHSLKDLPTELPEGLKVSSICERADLRDALVARKDIRSLGDLPYGATVGTSSLRRQAQLLAARPDLKIEPVRGNVDTRLRKLDEGKYAALVLAAAGLHRLGYRERITQYLDQTVMLSAPGQGAVALETRAGDSRVEEIALLLDHRPTRLACSAERAMLRALGGGCLVPIAALGKVDGNVLRLDGLVASPDGSSLVRAYDIGPLDDPEHIGSSVAQRLLRDGAFAILMEGSS
jgi:hydroxymethylbilane synthase